MRNNIKTLGKLLTICLVLIFTNCQKEEQLSNDEASLEKIELPITSRKIDFNNSLHYTNLTEQLSRINQELNSNNSSSRDITENLTIVLEDVLFTEYDNTHTYTFKILREQPAVYVENLVLHYNVENDNYDEYLVQYDITAEEFLELSNDGQLQSSENVTITTLEQGFFDTSESSRSCGRVCETIFVSCSSGAHNAGNIDQWAQCTEDQWPGGTLPFAYQSCTSTCPIIDAGDSGGGGGSGTSGGGSSDDDDIITKPNANNPCDTGNGTVGITGNDGCIVTTIDELNIVFGEGNHETDTTINPDDVPEELHFDTLEELQAFYDSLNSTNIESETTVDSINPEKVITQCTFPDWNFDFNVFIEQTLGDNYNVDEITSNITGFTMFVAYEQLNWTTTTVNTLANVSNVDVNSEAEVTLVYKGIGTIVTFGINFNIWLNMSDGSVNNGSITMD